MEENVVVVGESKTFYFDFEWSNDDDDNFKHEIEFIINSNEPLAENKITNKTERLFSKYKNGNNTHEHGKRMNHINLFLTCQKD